MVTGKLEAFSRREAHSARALSRNPERTARRISTPLNLGGAWRAVSPAARFRHTGDFSRTESKANWRHTT